MGYGLGHGPLLATGDTPPTPEHSLDEIAQEQTVDLAQAWQATIAPRVSTRPETALASCWSAGWIVA